MSDKRNRKYPNALFKVRVAGDLAYKDGDQEKSRPYDETVTMDQELIDQGALSMFVKHYGSQIFGSAQTPDGKPNPTRVPGFIRILTHQLISCRYADNPNRPVGIVALMNRQDLLKYIEVEGLPVDSDLYPDDSALQQAVLDCEDDEDAFEKNQEHKRKIQGPNIKNANKAKALLVGVDPGKSDSISPVETDLSDMEGEETEEVEEDVEEEVDEDNDPATPPVKRVTKKKVTRAKRK